MKKRIRIGLAVAAAVTGMLFALPALSASASPVPSGLQTFSRNFYSTSVPGEVNATLACPSGYRLVGSGVGHTQVLAETETPVQNFQRQQLRRLPAGYTAMAGGFYISNPDGSEATPGGVEWSIPAVRAAGISSWYVDGNAPINTKMVALAQCIR